MCHMWECNREWVGKRVSGWSNEKDLSLIFQIIYDGTCHTIENHHQFFPKCAKLRTLS